jgi:hypothetical protein
LGEEKDENWMTVNEKMKKKKNREEQSNRRSRCQDKNRKIRERRGKWRKKRK